MTILLAFFFTIGLVVIVHELGHFLMCKLFGVYVKTFSVGMGPKILARRFGETEYALSLIPFGGYVKMAGEGMMEEIQDTGTLDQRKYPLGTEAGKEERAGLDDHIPADRQFLNKPAWQRLLVFLAGPLANVVLAYAIYTGLFWHQGLYVNPVTEIGWVDAAGPAAAAGLQPGDQVLAVAGEPVDDWYAIVEGLVTNEPPVDLTISRGGETLAVELTVTDNDLGFQPHDNVVGRVQRGGPADRLGLQSGDRIIALDGEPVGSHLQVMRTVQQAAERELLVTWERDGQQFEGVVTPEPVEVMPDSSLGRINYEIMLERRALGLGEAIVMGHRQTWFVTSSTVSMLRQLVSDGKGIESVGGPIRIAQVAGEMARWGFDRLLTFIAFFSVNLFLLNMLPIPVLDGGHVLFLILEVLRGKPVNERIQGIATQIGLIFLLLFMTVVLVQDGVRVFTG